jgi:hypothetical protein
MRRAPVIKTPGDGQKRFGNTELTQSFENPTTKLMASRRQIVSRAAGDAAGECCSTTADPGSGGVTGNTTQQGQINTLTGRISSLSNLTYKNQQSNDQRFNDQQVVINDLITLITDLYTQGGWTPPIDIPTVEPVTGPS